MDKIEKGALKIIAEQIGDNIVTLANETRPDLLSHQPIELAESFRLWMVQPRRAIAASNSRLLIDQWLAPTSRWHHQIKFDGRAEAIAYSTFDQTDPRGWRLCELFVSPLAERIDEAINLIDERFGDRSEPVVRVVADPAHHLHALWLAFEGRGRDLMLVIDSPPDIQNLAAGKLYNARRFFHALSEEPQDNGVRFG